MLSKTVYAEKIWLSPDAASAAANSLSCAFMWARTKEGDEYWRTVFNKLQALAAISLKEEDDDTPVDVDFSDDEDVDTVDFYTLTPEDLDAGYIPFSGGDMPVPYGTLVDVIHQDGERYESEPAGYFISAAHNWEHTSSGPDADGNIIAYRLTEGDVESADNDDADEIDWDTLEPGTHLDYAGKTVAFVANDFTGEPFAVVSTCRSLDCCSEGLKSIHKSLLKLKA